MRRIKEPDVCDLRDSWKARRSAETAEAAVARLLAGLERSPGPEVDYSAYRDGLSRHGAALRRIGGVALLRVVFDRQCRAVPAQSSRRFDVLGRAWGPLLSRSEKL